MITIFSTCKPFSGIYQDIQINALRSWRQLVPEVRIVLWGNDSGTAEAAKTFEIVHYPTPNRQKTYQERDYDCMAYRTVTKPSVADMFYRMYEIADGPLIYVNSDMLLTNMSQVISNVTNQLPNFLVVGQRYNVTTTGLLEFKAGWEKKLPQDNLHPPCGIDYLAFSPGLWKNIPDITIGYCGWDNYMVETAVNMGVPVIDATKTVLVFHQNHPIRERGDTGDRDNMAACDVQSLPQLGGFITAATWVLDTDGLHVKTTDLPMEEK